MKRVDSRNVKSKTSIIEDLRVARDQYEIRDSNFSKIENLLGLNDPITDLLLKNENAIKIRRTPSRLSRTTK